MISLFTGLRTAAIAVTSIITVSLGAAQASQCQPFPKLSVWGNYTHAKVTRMVETRLDGNWDSYLARFDKRFQAIKAIQAGGKTLAIKSKGKRYTFVGKKLALYVRAAEQRRDVVHCLSAEAEVDQLQNFATAAGQDTPALLELAAVRSGELKMDVESQCIDGDVIFKITNRGDAWPKRGMVSIYRIGGGQLQKVIARRMRFSANQQVSFRVPAKRNVTGKLGLFFDPTWTRRPFALDATITCQ